MTRLVSVLGVVLTQDCAEELRAACAEAPGVRLEVEPASGDIDGLAARAGDRVLVVECRGGAAEDRRQLSRLARAHAGPVVAVVQEPTAQEMRALMHLGVLDVLPRPVLAAELADALDRARAQLQAVPQGRVFAFMRSCGGAGATTLALQMGHELIRRGGKRHKPKVCLIDFDLQFGNAGLALDLVDNAGLGQIIEGADRLDEEFLSSAMARHDGGLHVLTAPPEIVPFDIVSPDLVRRIVALARAQYDFVIVDLPHAWTDWTSAVLETAAMSFLVLQPGVTGVRRARDHLKLMAEEQLESAPKMLVANRVEKRLFNGWRRRLREAATALEHEIEIVVRRDDSTAEAARETGRPMRAVKRNGVIEKDVRRLVERALIATAAAAAKPKPAIASSAAAAPVVRGPMPQQAAE